MSLTELALLALLAWVVVDVALVGGWLATVGIVRRHRARRSTLRFGMSAANARAVTALRPPSGSRLSRPVAPRSKERRRGRAS